MLCLRDPQSPALEQGPAPSLLVFRRSQLCLLYTLAPRKQQMARLLLAPPHGSPHPRRLCQHHLAPLHTPWLSFLVLLLVFFPKTSSSGAPGCSTQKMPKQLAHPQLLHPQGPRGSLHGEGAEGSDHPGGAKGEDEEG